LKRENVPIASSKPEDELPAIAVNEQDLLNAILLGEGRDEG
jgi:hypothetical protein